MNIMGSGRMRGGFGSAGFDVPRTGRTGHVQGSKFNVQRFCGWIGGTSQGIVK